MNSRKSFRIPVGIFLLLATICASGLHAQETERKVSGTVTDRFGNSLPGVSVIVKETTGGTVSDMNGKYSVAISENAIL